MFTEYSKIFQRLSTEDHLDLLCPFTNKKWMASIEGSIAQLNQDSKKDCIHLNDFIIDFVSSPEETFLIAFRTDIWT